MSEKLYQITVQIKKETKNNIIELSRDLNLSESFTGRKILEQFIENSEILHINTFTRGGLNAQTTIQVPKNVKDKINSIAKTHNINNSYMCRIILEQFFLKHNIKKIKLKITE